MSEGHGSALWTAPTRVGGRPGSLWTATTVSEGAGSLEHMFEGREGRAGGTGGVPAWAFTADVRRDAAEARRSDPELGDLGRRLAAEPGGPRLVDLLRLALRTPTAGGGEGAASAHPDLPTPLGEELDWSALADVDTGSLVEVVAAFERVGAWARAGAARAAALLTERPQTRPQWPAQAGIVAEQCTASTDLSLRLGITRHAARTLLDAGRALDGPLRQPGAALESGEIAWEKARVLVERLQEVPLAVSLEVEAAVLPQAAALTPPQVARAAERALQRVDHRDAAERHARARRDRHVGRPRLLPDGMASVRAVLPAEAAVRLDACLQAAAVAGRRGADRRTTDQLRADALDALARSAWDAGWIGAHDSCSAGRSGDAHHGDAPVREGSVREGPVREGSVREGSVRDGSVREGPVPEGSVRDGTTSHGVPHAPGTTCDLTTADGGPLASASSRDRAAPTTPFTVGGAPRMRLAQDSGRGTLVSVTVGLGTLLGLDDRPGELAGYGPIGADVARLLATEGTWRRLVVDEMSGALLDVDRRRYRPPAGIVDHVRQRNRTCVFPTCSVPAPSCQLDHTVPFPHGPTAVDNLGPLCASHHQLKTHAGFRLEQPQPGTFVVRTPTGHVYLQAADRQPGVPSPDDVSPVWTDGPLPEVRRVWPPPDVEEPPF